MLVADWIENVRRNAAVLEELIAVYHPSSWGRIDAPKHTHTITAPNAEAACELVRRQITKKEAGLRDGPVERFRQALDTEDTRTLMSLLNGAWFGVPESTSSWGIVGFNEAVRLLEDPPEPEDDD